MGLQNDILTSLGEAFDTDLADAVQTFELVKAGTNYNPNTGNIILGETSKDNWRGVFSDIDKTYIQDGAELPIDTKVICLANEAPFIPDVNDTVITEVKTDTFDGTPNCFIIQRVMVDPTFSVYTLFCKSAAHGPIQSRKYA